MNPIDPDMPLDQFLPAAPELLQVFDRLGIDARRDGAQSLVEVCRKQGLDARTVVRLLMAFQAKPRREVVALELMTLTELCDHLEHTQRVRLRGNLARLDELRALAGDDSKGLPASAATRTIAGALARLDHAIQEQIYSENQALFRRALALGERDEDEQPDEQIPECASPPCYLSEFQTMRGTEP